MEGIIITPIARLSPQVMREFIHREPEIQLPIGCNRCGVVGDQLYHLRGEVLCFTHYEKKRLGLR